MPAIDFKALLKEERQRRKQGTSSFQKGGDDSAASEDVADLIMQKLEGHHQLMEGPEILAHALAKSRENVVEAKHLHQASLSVPHKAGIIDLSQYALQGKPSGVHYIPDYVSEEMEERIMELAHSLPDHHPGWIQVRGRRLQCYGGQPTDQFKSDPLPRWVQELSEEMVHASLFPKDLIPNHILLNEYQSGKGIMAHTDGPFYENKVAILSLGGPCIFNFRPRPSIDQVGVIEDRPVGTIVLQPRSLIYFTGEAYIDYLHEILPVTEDFVGQVDGVSVPVLNLDSSGTKLGDKLERKLRISMTFRHVKNRQSS